MKTPTCAVCGEVPRVDEPGLSFRPAIGDHACVWCDYWGVPPGPEREAARQERVAHVHRFLPSKGSSWKCSCGQSFDPGPP